MGSGSWLASALLIAACGFNPKGVAATDDAAPEPDTDPLPLIDAGLCFEGFTRVCLPALPDAPLVVASNQSIDTDAAACVATTMGTAAGICVVAATRIEIATGVTLRATGSKPLLLLATGEIDITGTLDAASHRDEAAVGAGANVADCPAGTAPNNTNNSAGGGFGGTFASTGGNGGESIGRGAAGIAPTTPIAPPTTLRGGCRGANGGNATSGTGGAGGGAIELIAASVTVTGAINASGAGGTGGINADGGGGGGGSGGMIVVDAPAFTLAGGGILMAQGGGGGGGSGNTGAGTPGSDPTTPGTAAPPGDGFHTDGGTGGAGGIGAITTNAGNAEAGNIIGGGGGGGGTGVIKSTGAVPVGSISPPLS